MVEGVQTVRKIQNGYARVVVVIILFRQGNRGVARNLFRRGTKAGDGERSPLTGPGAEPWWGSGGEAPRS